MYSCKKLKIRRSQNKMNHDNPELVKMRELIIDNIYPGFKTVTLFKTMHNGHREPVIGLETGLKNWEMVRKAGKHQRREQTGWHHDGTHGAFTVITAEKW